MEPLAQQALQTGLLALGLAEYESGLAHYADILQRWNRSYNLVASVDDQTLVVEPLD